MTSFISALSLLVLALVSVCFTLPIIENPLFETSSPFDYDVTTDKQLGERMAFDDATMFGTVADIKQSYNELMGLETSSMTEDATREPRMLEDATHESYMLDQVTLEPRMLADMTTDESFTFMPTTEGTFHQVREMTDSPMMTVEPTTEHNGFISRDFGMELHNETEVATESSHSKREFADSAFTTSESFTELRSSEQPFATMESEMSKLDMQMDFTTDAMSSFPSTSSAVAPELYMRDPSTTRKYTGLLADKVDQEEDKEHEDEEYKKPHGEHQYETEEHQHQHEDEEPKKVLRKPKIPARKHKYEEHQSEDEQESTEEKKESYGKQETDMEEHKQEGDKEVEEGREPEKHDEYQSKTDVEIVEPKVVIKKRPTTYRKANIVSDAGVQYPKAVYEQGGWKKVANMPSDFAILDETSDIVTVVGNVDSLDMVESHTEEGQLNQDEEPSRAE